MARDNKPELCRVCRLRYAEVVVTVVVLCHAGESIKREFCAPCYFRSLESVTFGPVQRQLEGSAVR